MDRDAIRQVVYEIVNYYTADTGSLIELEDRSQKLERLFDIHGGQLALAFLNLDRRAQKLLEAVKHNPCRHAADHKSCTTCDAIAEFEKGGE